MSAAGVFAGVAVVGVLAWRWRNDRRRWNEWREGLLEPCASLLSEAVIASDQAGWPTLRGNFEGHRCGVSLLLDDAGYRKLPVLWLRVAVETSRANEVHICATARPNNEYWSALSELRERLPTPSEWRGDVVVRSDRRVELSREENAAAESFFSNATAKELSISPNRILLTAMAMQSKRAEYLVLRASRFVSIEVSREQVLALLQVAVAIASTPRQLGAALAASVQHGDVVIADLPDQLSVAPAVNVQHSDIAIASLPDQIVVAPTANAA